MDTPSLLLLLLLSIHSERKAARRTWVRCLLGLHLDTAGGIPNVLVDIWDGSSRLDIRDASSPAKVQEKLSIAICKEMSLFINEINMSHMIFQIY